MNIRAVVLLALCPAVAAAHPDDRRLTGVSADCSVVRVNKSTLCRAEEVDAGGAAFPPTCEEVAPAAQRALGLRAPTRQRRPRTSDGRTLEVRIRRLDIPEVTNVGCLGSAGDTSPCGPIPATTLSEIEVVAHRGDDETVLFTYGQDVRALTGVYAGAGGRYLVVTFDFDPVLRDTPRDTAPRHDVAVFDLGRRLQATRP